MQTFQDTFEYTMTTSGSGFEWNVNPSTRPLVAGRDGRAATGPPQADLTFANPAGQPAENVGDPRAGAHEEYSFDVQGPPAVDNGRMTVHIDWGNPDTDWDLYIYDASGNVVAQSASFGDTTEDAILMDPPAGRYTAVIVNYDQIDGQPYDDWGNGRVDFESPRPRTETGVKEAWTITCRRPDGRRPRRWRSSSTAASASTPARPAPRWRRARASKHIRRAASGPPAASLTARDAGAARRPVSP